MQCKQAYVAQEFSFIKFEFVWIQFLIANIWIFYRKYRKILFFGTFLANNLQNGLFLLNVKILLALLTKLGFVLFHMKQVSDLSKWLVFHF